MESWYICEGELNEKQIAVKKLRPLPLVLEGQEAEEIRDSFSQQLLESARLVKQLSHPHIVKFIEFYRSEHGDHVLVMEWLECDLGKY